MRTLVGQDGVDAMDGIDDASGTVIRITFSNGNTLTQENPETKAIARVFRSGKDITDDQTDASFEWTRDSGNATADAVWAEAHKGMKQITLTADDLAGNVLISCSLTGESTLYGSMQYVMVDDVLADKMTVTHSPNGADENHTFRIEKGSLMLVVPAPEEEVPAEDEPEVDLEEVIEAIDPDAGEPADGADEPDIPNEEDIVEPEPEADEGMEDGGTEGDEATTDEDVNETEDVVYKELDEYENEDAGRVPKGVNYVLDEGHLRVPIELNGTITATATVYSDLPDQALEFKYNVDGLRTQKKLTKPDKSTVTTDYILHGDQVNHVTITEADTSGTVTATNNLHFYYDAANRPIALDFNGNKYFYAHNVHNDIAAILDNNGSIVVEYKYNAWGELLATTGTYATTLGKLNPFRYRGYVYDEESGLYYLRNRYYNPELQRFICADDCVVCADKVLGCNVYAYCLNNPVMYKDEVGSWPSFSSVMKAVSQAALIVAGAALVVAAAPALVVVGVGATATGAALTVAGAALGTAFVATGCGIVYEASKRKPVNLPSAKKVTLDMDHIMSGHGSGGNRGGPNKDRFPPWVTATIAEKIIRTAYKYGEKIASQGDRVFVRGPWGKDRTIEMWVNVVKKVIETAWPK